MEVTFCSKCGAQMNDGEQFCPACGAPAAAAQQPNVNYAAPVNEDGYSAQDIAENKGISVLSYLGPLVFVPMFARKNSPYAQYHVKQGFTLFLVWCAYLVVDILLNLIKVERTQYLFGVPIATVRVTPWYISLVCWLLALGVTALAVIGIINVVKGRAKKLPVIGDFQILK